MIVAVLGSGAGHGLVRGAQVSLAMTMAEAELARFGPATVLGALRTFERLGSIVGLLMIASLAGFAGYSAAIGAVAAWSLAGAAECAAFALRLSRLLQVRSTHSTPRIRWPHAGRQL